MIYKETHYTAWQHSSSIHPVGAFPSMQWAKGKEPACTGRQSIAVWTHSVVLCVKRKVSVDPCWPSVYSAESGPISSGINAQRGISILPAVHRPRDSLSQPRPFTVRCPLSVSFRHSHKDSISPPPATLPLSHALLKLLLAGALLCELLSYRRIPLCTPWHEDSDDDKRSISRKKYRRRRRRGQQLWTWKNNSCDSRIVIPTFVSCWVQQQVSSRHGNHRTDAVLHPQPKAGRAG